MKNLFKNTALLVCLLFISSQNFGQTPAFPQTTFPASVNGKSLKSPFAGGLNAPQFSSVDLNNDGILDLFAFDRFGNKILTFLQTEAKGSGTANYVFAPEYAKNFPPLVNWALMRDFNGDGAGDIFCASLAQQSFEVQVFRGFFEGNVLKFKQMYFKYPPCTTCSTNFLYYPDEIPGLWNNLVISSEDIPDFADVDGDGDLDLLTFDAAAGGHVWLYQNQSVEKGFGRDSIQMKLVDRCWGRFYESGLVACKNSLAPHPDSCLFKFAPVDDRDGMHPGSTVCVFDEDADGDMEIVLGDISFSCLNQMTNGGSKTSAWMTKQDTFFPSYDVSADVVTFPAAFILDLDNDLKKDMIVAPNARGVIEDQRNCWFYKNTDAGAKYRFDLQKTDFLTGDMIDLGSVTHPAIVDVNADGLFDLVVGTQGFFTPGNALNARLFLFLNIGNSTSPNFQLSDSDWLGMSQFTPNDSEFSPAFGDLDSDGDLDLLVGSQYGAVYFYENVAGKGNPMQFQKSSDPYWLTLDVSQTSSPVLIDLDSDGLLDLVMGERAGNLNFFKNVGSKFEAKFNATPTVEKLGGMNAKFGTDVVGFSSVAFVPSADGLLAVVGTFQGVLKTYKFTNVADAAFPLVFENWGQVDVGTRSHPVFADLDSDGLLDAVVGNTRGGLEIFKTNLKTSTAAEEPDFSEVKIEVSPNPTSGLARVRMSRVGAFEWQAVDLLGRQVAQGAGVGDFFEMFVNGWESGVYLLNLNLEGQFAALKLVVAR